MRNESALRPIGITALSIFFLFGACASFLSFVSLFWPGSFLEPMWRLNPRARVAFGGMGMWAVVLMGAVCAACAGAALGLWRGARWGHRLAFAILTLNMLGDVMNVALGIEPRAAVGIPIAFQTTARGGGRGKKGFSRMKSLALALVVVLFYFMLIAFGQALGDGGADVAGADDGDLVHHRGEVTLRAYASRGGDRRAASRSGRARRGRPRRGALQPPDRCGPPTFPG